MGGEVSQTLEAGRGRSLGEISTPTSSAEAYRATWSPSRLTRAAKGRLELLRSEGPSLLARAASREYLWLTGAGSTSGSSTAGGGTTMDRRDFLKTAVGAGVLAATSKPSEARASLPQRALGKTGVRVSVLAFGGGSHFLSRVGGDERRVEELSIERSTSASTTSTPPPATRSGRISDCRRLITDGLCRPRGTGFFSPPKRRIVTARASSARWKRAWSF